nr:glycosyltransferase [uncultured Carboxylicivirga sp.]
MQLAPVIVFCFNRPDHIEQTLDTLKKCRLADQTKLYIFSDGPRNAKEAIKIKEVREVIHAVEGFQSVEVIEREENWGLAKSIISGVTQVIKEHKRVIVLEDDLICSESFIENKNKMLDYFEPHKNIFSTSGFCPPIKIGKECSDDLYLFYRTSSLGWGTWIDRWESVNWSLKGFNNFIQSKEKRKQFNRGGIDLTPMLLHQKVGKIDSWSVRFSYAASLQDKMCVFPTESMLYHIGSDGSGTHADTSSDYGHTASNKVISISNFPKENAVISAKVRKYWANSLIRQVINYYKRLVYISIIKL